jgi:predicted metal-dependent hydrolase
MDARLREGIRLFNDGCFFESHESFEDFYLRADEEHKAFMEGLIQLAVACRMLSDFGEVKGAVRLARQALIRLENYQPRYLQIRVKDLIRSMDEWAGQAQKAAGGSIADVRAKIPKIRVRRFL